MPSPRAHSRRESTCCFQIAHLLLSITSSCRDSLGRKGRSFVCLYVRLPCKILFVFQRTPSSGECSSGLATRCSGGAPHKGKIRRERIREKKKTLVCKSALLFSSPYKVRSGGRFGTINARVRLDTKDAVVCCRSHTTPQINHHTHAQRASTDVYLTVYGFVNCVINIKRATKSRVAEVTKKSKVDYTRQWKG